MQAMSQRLLTFPGEMFEQFIQPQSDFIARLKAKAQYKSLSVLSQSSTVFYYLLNTDILT